jgi:hypothetical protein
VTITPMDSRQRAIRLGAVLSIGVVWILVLRWTAPPSKGSDSFDSPLFLWSYLLLPSVAFLVARTRFEPSPITWAALIPAPAAVWTILGGTVFFDHNQGGSFWIVGEMFLLVLSVLVGVGAAVGTLAGQRNQSKSRRIPLYDASK